MKDKILLLLICLIFSSFVNAQTKSGDVAEAENLNRRSGKFYALGDYDNALKLALKELSLRKTIGDDKYIAAVLYNIGGIYRQKQKLSKSLKYLETALVHYRKGYGREHEKVFKALKQLTIVCLLNDQKRKAVDVMEDAKLLGESLYGKESLEVASLLLDQARVYSTMRRYTDVKTAYEQAILINDKYAKPSYNLPRSEVDEYMCFLSSAPRTNFVKSWNKFQRQRADNGFRKIKKGIVLGEEVKIGLPNYYWSSAKYKSYSTIAIRVLVNEKGVVVKSQIMCGGSERAKKATLKAANESRYTPTLENGKPIKIVRLILYSAIN